MGMARQQLTLLDSPASWRMSEATRAVGRRGIAEARASLQAALAAGHQEEASTGTAEHPSHRRSAA
jgi:hypothetical protein